MNKLKILLYKLETYNVKMLILLILLLVNLAALIIGSLIVYLTTDSFGNLLSAMWWVVKAIVDPGFLDEQRGGYLTIISFILVVLGFITFNSGVIALTSTMMIQRMERIRKGKRKIPFSDHTVILNWNDKIYEIINEFLTSGEKEEIIVLAEGDKEEYESLIRKNIDKGEKAWNSKGNIVLYKQGCPYNSYDLSLVNVNSAKTIVVLSDQSCKKDIDKDMVTIKTLMALTNSKCNTDSNTIAEINLQNNVKYARLVYKDRKLSLLNGNRIIGRIMAQASMQPYIEKVYEELFSFKDNEIYIKTMPNNSLKINNKNGYKREQFIKYFVSNFSDNVPIGYVTSSDEPLLNPDFWIIDKDTKIITVAKDESKINCTSMKMTLENLPKVETSDNEIKMNILIIGCNSKLENVLNQYKSFMDDMNVSYSSGMVLSITVLSRNSMDYSLQGVKNLNFKHVNEDLDSEDKARKFLSDNKFDSILILSDEDTSMKEKDINILKWVIMIKELYNEMYDMRIITEVLDPRNSSLIKDYTHFGIIISNKIVSKLITQESKNKYLEKIYKELITYKGNEIYIKDAGKYFNNGISLSFGQILYSVSQYGDIAIGLVQNEDLKLNPGFEDKFTIEDGVKLVVISKDIM